MGLVTAKEGKKSINAEKWCSRNLSGWLKST
jgi:hypothetical protein